jgi:hypothetical protein
MFAAAIAARATTIGKAKKDSVLKKITSGAGFATRVPYEHQ